jgi:hypothetical protein
LIQPGSNTQTGSITQFKNCDNGIVAFNRPIRNQFHDVLAFSMEAKANKKNKD